MAHLSRYSSARRRPGASPAHLSKHLSTKKRPGTGPAHLTRCVSVSMLCVLEWPPRPPEGPLLPGLCPPSPAPARAAPNQVAREWPLGLLAGPSAGPLCPPALATASREAALPARRGLAAAAGTTWRWPAALAAALGVPAIAVAAAAAGSSMDGVLVRLRQGPAACRGLPLAAEVCAVRERANSGCCSALWMMWDSSSLHAHAFCVGYL